MLRHDADYRQLELVEATVRRATAYDIALAAGAFTALHVPGLSTATLTAVARESLALYDSLSRPPFAQPMNARRSSLSVALLRGSANSNHERLATLLSLDQRRFDVGLYTTALDHADAAELRGTVRMAGYRWHHTPLGETTDEQAAELLGRRGPCDMALDGSGHTVGHRLPLLSRRPCAVRTGVLGFAASTGGALDYATVDRLVAPPRAARHLAERSTILPHTYQVPPAADATAAAAAAMPHAAAARGRPRAGPLLGIFVRSNRIHPLSFGQWMASLRHTPTAALWLLDERAGEARRNLVREAAAAGIAVRRLGFVGFAPKVAHLARHHALTLALDTSPLYASHTTAADALRAGTPLLPLPAERWASRVSTGGITAVGLPHLASATHRAQLSFSCALVAPTAMARAQQRGAGAFDTKIEPERLPAALRLRVSESVRWQLGPRPVQCRARVTQEMSAADFSRDTTDATWVGGATRQRARRQSAQGESTQRQNYIHRHRLLEMRGWVVLKNTGLRKG